MRSEVVLRTDENVRVGQPVALHSWKKSMLKKAIYTIEFLGSFLVNNSNHSVVIFLHFEFKQPFSWSQPSEQQMLTDATFAFIGYRNIIELQVPINIIYCNNLRAALHHLCGVILRKIDQRMELFIFLIFFFSPHMISLIIRLLLLLPSGRSIQISCTVSRHRLQILNKAPKIQKAPRMPDNK